MTGFSASVSALNVVEKSEASLNPTLGLPTVCVYPQAYRTGHGQALPSAFFNLGDCQVLYQVCSLHGLSRSEGLWDDLSYEDSSTGERLCMSDVATNW